MVSAGHLVSIGPGLLVDMEVEVLDVTEDEAPTLLLSIDRLASLAAEQEPFHDRLRQLVPAVPPELAAAWEAAAGALLAEPQDGQRLARESLPEAFYVLVTCRDERQQVELLGRFKSEGLECKAVLG